MKKLLLTAILSTSLAAGAQGAAEATYLFDFGGQGSRGTVTTAAGWNNITTAAEADQKIAKHTSYTGFVDSQGNAAPDGMKIVLTTEWGANGAGGLTSPSADLLGDMAVATATTDYIFNTNNGDSGRSFVVAGLDPAKGYRFTIFGSRSANDVRSGWYILSGANSWAVDMQVAGSGLGDGGANQRTGDAPVSDVIFPDAAGCITLWIDNYRKTYVPLSCMKIERVAASRPASVGTVARTFMLDFGSNVSGRGQLTETVGWNNIINNSGNNCTAGTDFTALVDAAGTATGVKLTVNTQFVTNGESGGGGLTAPDAALLGDFAVATATGDYFFVDKADAEGSMTFSGLNPQRSYRFHIFASRKASDARLGAYRLEGLNDWTGAMQAAGNALDGTTSSLNDRVILVSEPVFPASDGTVKLTMLNGSKVYLPVNVMKIEELTGVERPDIKTYVSAVIAGDGIAQGEATALSARGKNVFEIYVKLAAGNYTVTATDDADATVDIPVEGVAEGVNRITVDLNTYNVTVTPVTYFCVTGSAVGGWNTTGQEMTYVGSGRWNFKGELKGYDTFDDSGRVNFVMNKDWNMTFKRVNGSASELTASGGQDIPLNPANYDITVDLNAMTWTIANGLDRLDPARVTVMGSSVSNGQGADDHHGYAWLYGEQLAARTADGVSSTPFYISSIAINGNSSVSLLNRFDDLEREYGSYVIYGISLGNEGIHEATDKEEVYNQFRTNMLSLISKARETGKEPVVMNNYTRTDFTADDYDAVKRMNDEIAFWDVPSVNMLGAIDDGAGHWVKEYGIDTDIYHPNTAGHAEFFYAMVPSMMDAMASGKELTMNRTTDASYRLPEGATVEFTPDGTVHSFTLALTAELPEATLIATVPCESGNMTVARDAAGNIVVTLPDGETLSAPASSGMNSIAVSQNYARKYLTLEVNGAVEAKTVVPVAPKSVAIGNPAADAAMTLGEVMFYRSSMHTSSPFTADGRLNKSSLELYAPMSENPVNKAMSTLPVKIVEHDLTGVEAVAAEAAFRVSSDRPGAIDVFATVATDVTVVNAAGAMIARAAVDGNREFAGLHPGVYMVNNCKVIVR